MSVPTNRPVALIVSDDQDDIRLRSLELLSMCNRDKCENGKRGVSEFHVLFFRFGPLNGDCRSLSSSGVPLDSTSHAIHAALTPVDLTSGFMTSNLRCSIVQPNGLGSPWIK